MAKNKTIKRRIRRVQPIHKKFILHPIVAFAILFAGVAMVGLTLEATALNVSVVAEVAAPIPTAPAEIQIVQPAGSSQQAVPTGNSTQNPLTISTNRVTLTGSCPKNTHLEFYRNDIFAGVTPCVGDPTFSIQIDLVPGINTIIARVFNITGEQGPVSLPFYVEYIAPKLSKTSSSQQSASLSPLTATSNFNHLGFLVGQPGTWNVNIQGGKAPYTIVVTWGDGQSTTYNLASPGSLDISHTYSSASANTGYPIDVKVKDSLGHTSDINLMTIISNANSKQAEQVAMANAALNPSFLTKAKHWLWVAWPAYVILLLMMVSFWLGEREEYSRLVNKMRRNKRK